MNTVGDILKAVQARFSFERVESWDRVGLLVGDTKASVSQVFVAHEITDEVLDSADDCEVVLTYHPLIFRGLENLNFSNPTARLVARCIRENRHVIAAHTALDHATMPHALGDYLARSLHLQNIGVLGASGRESLWKIVVFVPERALQEVCNALWGNGAGQIGKYERASFRTAGTGTFQAKSGAQPSVGEIGEFRSEAEWRLEVIVPQNRRDDAVRSLLNTRFYEEIAHDIVPLHNSIEPYGSCRVGELKSAQSLDELAAQVLAALQPPNVRLVRAPNNKPIRRVACVPGAGASFLETCAKSGVDCLVSGDFKHHDALKARALGVHLIDVTHTPTERAALQMLAGCVREKLEVEVHICELDTNPFSAF